MKPLHTLLPIAAVCLLSTGSLHAGTLSGHLLGADGRPVPAGDVHIFSAGRGIGSKPLATTSVGRDGSFTVKMPEGEFFTLVATAADHSSASLMVPGGTSDEKITLDITLPHLSYSSTIDGVKIVGDWNDFDFAKATEMKRLPDGSYLYEMEASGQKEVSYQLLGIVGEGLGRFGRSVNAPGGTNYSYDGGGDYRNVVPVENGRVKIVFNPASLQRGGAADPSFTFDKGHDWMNTVVSFRTAQKNIRNLVAQRTAALAPVMTNAIEKNATLDEGEIKRIVGEYHAQIDKAAEPLRKGLDDRNPNVRMFAAMALAEQPELDPIAVVGVTTALPAKDERWKLNPQAQWRIKNWMTRIDQDGVLELQKNAWRTAAFRSFGSAAIATETEPNGEERAEAMAGRIIEAFPEEVASAENGDIGYEIRSLNPNRVIKVGKMVPEFNVTLLDGTQVSRESMHGKTYMIDFWAVWCGPCRAELPGLHAAYNKFKTRGLEVLSLSFDQKVADVEKFRLRPETPMPWMHSFVEGAFGSDLAKAFEVEGIPKPILVGPDGRILASGEQLRGSELEKTLEKNLRLFEQR